MTRLCGVSKPKHHVGSFEMSERFRDRVFLDDFGGDRNLMDALSRSLHPLARRLAFVCPVSERSVVIATIGVSVPSLDLSLDLGRFRLPGSRRRIRCAHFRSLLGYLFAQDVDDGDAGFACCRRLCRLLDDGRKTSSASCSCWSLRHLVSVTYPKLSSVIRASSSCLSSRANHAVVFVGSSGDMPTI